MQKDHIKLIRCTNTWDANKVRNVYKSGNLKEKLHFCIVLHHKRPRFSYSLNSVTVLEMLKFQNKRKITADPIQHWIHIEHIRICECVRAPEFHWKNANFGFSSCIDWYCSVCSHYKYVYICKSISYLDVYNVHTHSRQSIIITKRQIFW